MQLLRLVQMLYSHMPCSYSKKFYSVHEKIKNYPRNPCALFNLCYNKRSTILIPPPRPLGIAPAKGALLL
jgi:hypothetical protein